MSDTDNPLYSSLNSIHIENSTGSISLEINRKNEECEFHRLEMNSSVFDVFPSGTLIVKDNNDIITKLVTRGITYIKLSFTNVSYYYRIHSVGNVNNYASVSEDPYVAIYFSNDFYTFCQENTLSDLKKLEKPKVYKIDSLIKEIASSDYNQIDPTTNFVCFRPLNPKMDGTEIATDNVAEYINYLASLAVQNNNPRFLFWSDWRDGKLLNFHYVRNITSYPIAARYKIYSDDSAARGNLRKIYSYTTNQAVQYITREYYYVRKTPKILDLPKDGDNVFEQLAYQFLDDGKKYNIEIIGTSGLLNTIPPGAEEIHSETPWGYLSGNNSSGLHSPSTHMSNQYGQSEIYKNFSINGFKGAYEFLDNPEMWKNVFDLTPIHPNYPLNNDSDFTNLQKVLDIKFEAQKIEADGADTQLKKIRDIELQNFILYALCCMGDKDGEDQSFFAKLTKAVSDSDYDDNTGRKWFYEWKQIIFNPPNEESQQQLSQEQPSGLEFSNKWYLLGDTGYWKNGPDNSTISGYAVNLNETGNTLASIIATSHIQPGWKTLTTDSTSTLREMKYRPIGAMSGSGEHTPDNKIFAIVKMYKKSWEKLLIEGGYTGPIAQDIKGKYFCYFSAENIVDGNCAPV